MPREGNRKLARLEPFVRIVVAKTTMAVRNRVREEHLSAPIQQSQVQVSFHVMEKVYPSIPIERET